MAVSFLDEIENLKKKAMNAFSKETLEELIQITDEMAREGVKKHTLQEGEAIPSFELTDADNQTVSSEKLLSQGPLVISFYRGGWCSFCSLELRFLQNIYPQIKSLGANLVAISPEITEYAHKTKETNHLEFPVLSDCDNKLSKKFGLIFELVKNVANIYRINFDLDLKGINGNEDYEFPIPATYVVKPDGKIHYAFINVDYTARLEPEVLIEKVKEICE